MNIWHDLNPKRVTPNEFIVCIEISKNSKMKYELDKETGRLILDRVLFTSTHYPANYGFIPKTYAGDFDPLDVLVLCQSEIVPLCLVKCRPIGVIKMIDNDQVDEKVIAVPVNDPSWNSYQNIVNENGITKVNFFFKFMSFSCATAYNKVGKIFLYKFVINLFFISKTSLSFIGEKCNHIALIKVNIKRKELFAKQT